MLCCLSCGRATSNNLDIQHCQAGLRISLRSPVMKIYWKSSLHWVEKRVYVNILFTKYGCWSSSLSLLLHLSRLDSHMNRNTYESNCSKRCTFEFNPTYQTAGNRSYYLNPNAWRPLHVLETEWHAWGLQSEMLRNYFVADIRFDSLSRSPFPITSR